MRQLLCLLILFVTTLQAQVPVDVFTQRLSLDYIIQTNLLVSNAVLKQNIHHGIIPKTPVAPKITTIQEADLSSEDVAHEVLLQSLITNNYVIAVAGSNYIYKFYTIAQIDSILKTRPTAYRKFKQSMIKVPRMHGLTAASVWFISEIAQIIAMPVSSFFAAPHVGLMIMASPLSFINLAITLNVINISHNVQLKNAYGGYKKKRVAARIQKQTNKAFGIRNENSILHHQALVNDSQVFFCINRNNFFVDVAGFLKVNQHKAYFRNVKLFCEKYKNCDTLNNILNNRNISKQMRCIFAINYLHTYYPNIYNDFINTFYKSVIKQPSKDCSIIKDAMVKQWIYRLCEVKNLNALEPILYQMPPNIKVYEVLELFDNIIIKYWAENMRQQDFYVFRKFVKGFKKTTYQLLHQSDEPFTQQHADVLLVNCKLL
jgi:hypothetical protein